MALCPLETRKPVTIKQEAHAGRVEPLRVHRRMQSRYIPPALFWVPMECLVVHLKPLLFRVPRFRITTLPHPLPPSESPSSRTRRTDSGKRFSFHRHDQQFPGYLQPQRLRKSLRGRQVPMRPHASIGAAGKELGDEGGAVAETSISRINRNLRGPVGGEPS